MHTPNYKYLTRQYKHHQQAQDLSISNANPHTRNNHKKSFSSSITEIFDVNLQ